MGWAPPRVAARSDAEARPGMAAYDASEYLDTPAVLEARNPESATWSALGGGGGGGGGGEGGVGGGGGGGWRGWGGGFSEERASICRPVTGSLKVNILTWLLLGHILHFCLLWFGGKSPLNC